MIKTAGLKGPFDANNNYRTAASKIEEGVRESAPSPEIFLPAELIQHGGMGTLTNIEAHHKPC